LTASALPINESNKLPGIDYKFIFMMDLRGQDILGDNLLEEAIAYIEQAVSDGANIVVHW
jgi:protein-tyrosine phosphatase